MKQFTGFERGLGIGGWLTNFKRYNVLPKGAQYIMTVGDEEHFENYISKADIENIASFGVDHVRLAFDHFVMEPVLGTYRERSFELLDRAIDWCHQCGLNVNLNMHKCYGNYCDVPEEETILTRPDFQERFIALWEVLEHRYHDRPYVAFELLNEMRYNPASEWNQILVRTVDAIRAINKDRIIIVGGNGWNGVGSLEELQIFEDENVVYTFHFYSPLEFTHQRGVLQKEHMMYNRDMPYPTEDVQRYRECRAFLGWPDEYVGWERIDIEYLRHCLQPVFAFIEKHPDKILYCGEFSVLRHVPMVWRENWLNDVIKLFKENEIPYSAWNYLSCPFDGNKSGVVDDDHRRILSPRLLRILGGHVE